MLSARQAAQVVASVVPVRSLSWLVAESSSRGLSGEEDVLLQSACVAEKSASLVARRTGHQSGLTAIEHLNAANVITLFLTN